MPYFFWGNVHRFLYISNMIFGGYEGIMGIVLSNIHHVNHIELIDLHIKCTEDYKF